jgi:hypothetical protein
MKGFAFNKQTSSIALVFFTIYFFYGAIRIPLHQFLSSIIIGALVWGYTNSYEYASIALLIANFVIGMYRMPRGYGEGFVGMNPTEISARVGGMKKAWENHDVVGVGSKTTEGFEDAKTITMTLNPETPPTEKKETAPIPTVESKPAPTPTAQVPTPTATNNNNATPANGQPATTLSSQGVPPVTQPAETMGFQDSGSLFKIGQIPKDTKGGFHIDAGTTVINALNALKPDQIAAMTKDTQALIDTQKSLMGMLQTFQPMVSEGKQMMDTFQQMFGASAGALGTSANMLGNK